MSQSSSHHTRLNGTSIEGSNQQGYQDIEQDVWTEVSTCPFCHSVTNLVSLAQLPVHCSVSASHYDPVLDNNSIPDNVGAATGPCNAYPFRLPPDGGGVATSSDSLLTTEFNYATGIPTERGLHSSSTASHTTDLSTDPSTRSGFLRSDQAHATGIRLQEDHSMHTYSGQIDPSFIDLLQESPSSSSGGSASSPSPPPSHTRHGRRQIPRANQSQRRRSYSHKSAEEPYYCCECGRGYTRLYSRDRHVRSLHRYKIIYVCSDCHHAIPEREDKMREHQRDYGHAGEVISVDVQNFGAATWLRRRRLKS